jgi:hypothetical protein
VSCSLGVPTELLSTCAPRFFFLIQMADEKAAVSLDEADIEGDEALSQLLDGHGSLRLLRVTGASSGSVLTDVLIARRVLSLNLSLVPAFVLQPLALRPGVSPDSLLVTRLSVLHRKKDERRLSPSIVESVGALTAAFPALTNLSFSFPDSVFSSHLFTVLCSALRSA